MAISSENYTVIKYDFNVFRTYLGPVRHRDCGDPQGHGQGADGVAGLAGRG